MKATKWRKKKNSVKHACRSTWDEEKIYTNKIFQIATISVALGYEMHAQFEQNISMKEFSHRTLFEVIGIQTVLFVWH